MDRSETDAAAEARLPTQLLGLRPDFASRRAKASFMSQKRIDKVLTEWAREWWPEAEVYSVRTPQETEEFWLWTHHRGKISLGTGRLDARLSLHLVINSGIQRSEIGPDER